MDEKEILREAMFLSDVNQGELAAKCGYKSPSSVSNIFSLQSSLRVDIFAKLLDAIGYDIIVRGRNKVKALGGIEYIPEWVVRGEDEPDGDDTDSNDTGSNDTESRDGDDTGGFVFDELGEIGDDELDEALEHLNDPAYIETDPPQRKRKAKNGRK